MAPNVGHESRHARSSAHESVFAVRKVEDREHGQPRPSPQSVTCDVRPHVEESPRPQPPQVRSPRLQPSQVRPSGPSSSQRGSTGRRRKPLSPQRRSSPSRRNRQGQSRPRGRPEGGKQGEHVRRLNRSSHEFAVKSTRRETSHRSHQNIASRRAQICIQNRSRTHIKGDTSI